MPIPRLVNLLFGGSVGQPTQVAFEQGTLELIQGNGMLLVNLNGRLVSASPTTDEHFKEGDHVWISRTESGGYIVHGGVR